MDFLLFMMKRCENRHFAKIIFIISLDEKYERDKFIMFRQEVIF